MVKYRWILCITEKVQLRIINKTVYNYLEIIQVANNQNQFGASNSNMVSSVREVYGNTNKVASEPSEHNVIVVQGDEPGNLEWEDGMNVEIGQQFESKTHMQKLVERGLIVVGVVVVSKIETTLY